VINTMATFCQCRVKQSDITAMLARKSQLQISSKPTAMSAMERSRLNQARTLAQRRNDWNEVAEIDAKLAEAARTSEQEHPPRTDNVQDLLAKVNERNRKANMEAVRKAEMAEVERKKKERKLLAQNGGRSTPVDPSARLKTLPRIFNSNTPVTRLVTISYWRNRMLIYILLDLGHLSLLLLLCRQHWHLRGRTARLRRL
jgi:RNA polymerase-associated protein RTF1